MIKVCHLTEDGTWAMGMLPAYCARLLELVPQVGAHHIDAHLLRETEH